MKCRGCLLAWGSVQLLLGISMLICGSLLIAWQSVAGQFGIGLWGGIWALITGIVGIASGATRMKGLAVAFMVLSIIGALLISLPTIVVSLGTSRYENGCEFEGTAPDLNEMLNFNNIVLSAQNVVPRGARKKRQLPSLTGGLGSVMSILGGLGGSLPSVGDLTNMLGGGTSGGISTLMTQMGSLPGIGDLTSLIGNNNVDVGSATNLVSQMLHSGNPAEISQNLNDVKQILAALEDPNVTPANAVYLSALKQVQAGQTLSDMTSAISTVKSTYNIEWQVVNKNGMPTCACASGYNNMFGTELALVAFGAILLIAAILSSIFACCAVCRCCGGGKTDVTKIHQNPQNTVVTRCPQQSTQPIPTNCNANPNGQQTNFNNESQMFGQQPNFNQLNQSQQSFTAANNYNNSNMSDLPPVVMH